MNLWLIIIISGLLTFAIRLSFIEMHNRYEMPEGVRLALRFVPVVVLSAIIFPEIFVQGGNVALSIENPRLIAGVLAAIIAWRTRNAILTIAIGMASLWVLQAIFA